MVKKVKVVAKVVQVLVSAARKRKFLYTLVLGVVLVVEKKKVLV